MKIAISTTGIDLDAILDSRFGRAKAFLIFDEETKKYELKDNTQNLNAAQGAGIQAAKNVVDSGAGAVITGHCGPKAYKALQSAGVKVFCSKPKPIKALIEQYSEGILEEISSPDVEGHW